MKFKTLLTLLLTAITMASYGQIQPYAATDGLGRVLPLNEETGDPKSDRHVAMFYFLWTGAGDNIAECSWDLDVLWREHPEVFEDFSSPYWGGGAGIDGRYYYWGQPIYGYYHGLNVNEVKADADTVVVPDAVLGFYVTSCNPSALSPSVKVLELNERIDYLGDQNSEGLRSGFAGTFLESILVASGNKNFESYEGVLYASGSDLPVIIPGAMRVVHLRSAAFEKNEAVYYHDSVEEIHFAEGTPSIAAAAVEGCPNLKRVYVPASAEVADGAFPAGVEIVRF